MYKKHLGPFSSWIYLYAFSVIKSQVVRWDALWFSTGINMHLLWPLVFGLLRSFLCIQPLEHLKWWNAFSTTSRSGQNWQAQNIYVDSIHLYLALLTSGLTDILKPGENKAS